MKTVRLLSGENVPALGMGTWNMGNSVGNGVGTSGGTRSEEIATLQLGLSLGLRLIDTAEMYGEGDAELLVGEAIAGRRDEVFLVSKVYPHNASLRGTVTACERSLKRLRTDRLDLYLLHWRGNIPLADTLEAFSRLQEQGKIRHFGVSNFDMTDMQEARALPGGSTLATNQVLYNLMRRGIEWDLLPWCRERGIPIMAYSPIEQSRLVDNRKLIDFAQRHGITPAHAALGWLLARDDIIAIPKTARRERLRENLRALEQPLDAAQLNELDELFPPPRSARPLEML